MQRTTPNLALDVYDYEQLSKMKERSMKLNELKAINKDEYKRVFKENYGAEYLKQFYLA